MKRSNARLVAGLMAGVALGALGPLFEAVAWHTGNDSGNEAVTFAAGLIEEYAATAGWNMDFDSNIENGHDDHFLEIAARRAVAGTAAPGGQDAEAAWTGEVVAWGALPGDPVRTWRGTIDPAAGAVFGIDPLTGIASFRGVLVEEESGASCAFRVGWAPGAPAGVSMDQSVDWTIDRADAEADVVAGRPAFPSIIEAPACWPTLPTGTWTGGAHGSLLATSTVGLHVVDGTHGCARVPVRGRVCWRAA